MSRKPRPIDKDFLNHLNDSPNDLLEWDDLFDLFNLFERQSVSKNVLDALDQLIRSKAPLEQIEIRNIIDDLKDDLAPSYKYISTPTLITFLKDLAKTGGLKNTSKIDVNKIRQKSLHAAWVIQKSAIDHAISRVSIFHGNKSAENALAILKSWKKNLRFPKMRLVKYVEIERIRNAVAVDRASESSFILEHLKSIGDKISSRTQPMLTQAGKKALKFPMGTSREDISSIELRAFEKILRNGTFNKEKTLAEKKAFIKKAFYFQCLDYLKSLPKLDYTEISSPIELKEIKKMSVQYRSKNKEKKDVVNVQIYKPQKILKKKRSEA